METVAPSGGDRPLVLVVDDDRQVNLCIRGCLEGDYRTEFALDGRAGLEKALLLHPDLIVSDVMMPELRGDALVEAIRARHELDRTPILLLTANPDDELRVRVLRGGAQDFVQKPFSFDELRARVANLVNAKRADDKNRELNAELAASNRRLVELAEALRGKNEELQADLQLAREVQQAFLPQRYPLFLANDKAPEGTLRFRHRYAPTGLVGGDFFDVLPISDSQAGVFICDVMGHGVRAALVTAMLRTLIGDRGRALTSPGRLLAQLNRGLRATLKDTDSPMFASAFYLVLDAAAGEVRYASAGHPSPLVVHASGRPVEALRPSSEGGQPPLGLTLAPRYSTGGYLLSPGERLLLFTDGVYELELPSGELLGQDGLRQLVQELGPLEPDRFLDELLARLRGLAATGELSDDACLLSVDLAAPPELRAAPPQGGGSQRPGVVAPQLSLQQS